MLMGKQQLRVNCSIDWLSVTTEHGRGELSPVNMKGEKILGKGMMGYAQSYRFDNGLIHLWDANRPEVHIIYNGSTLKKLPGGFDEQWLVEWHLGAGHKVTRIDTAIDVFDSGHTISEFADVWASGNVKTRARTGTFISDPRGDNGDTFYVGSRKKKRKLLRVYDKGLEQRVDEDWIRFEMQYNGGAARSAARQVDTAQDLYTLFAGQLASFCSFEHPLFRELTADIKKIPVRHNMPTGLDKRLEWVMSSVVPALVTLEREQPGFMMFLASEILERIKLR